MKKMPQGRRFPKSDNIQRHRCNHACAYSYFHGKQNSTTCSIIRVIPDYKDFISFLRGLIYYLTVLVQCCRFSYFCSPFRYIILLWFIEVGCGDASGFVSKLSSSVLCETLVLPSSA